MAYNVMTQI